ncbi:MAG: hypothetical protein FD180_82 [Planctomycetota bacterium]|nr:MAG: hypothetical protein FD180_82 [Planctomycetota bacterium]
MALLAARSFAEDAAAAKHAVKEGDAALAKKQFDDALTYYSLAISLDPLGTSAWHERGLMRWRRHEFKAAIEDLQKAVEIFPENAGFHNDLGLAKVDDGDLAGGIASYDTSIRLSSDCALVWNNRAYANRLARDVDGAVKDATMALQLDPNFARAYLNRGLLLYDVGEWEDALADLEKNVELQSEDRDKSVELESGGHDFTHLRIWILRTRLGKNEAADKGLREWLKGRKPGPDRAAECARFLLGDMTEAEFIAPPRGDFSRHALPRYISERGFFAGSKALLEGRTEDAQKHFETALKKDVLATEITRSIEAELKPLIEKPKK